MADVTVTLKLKSTEYDLLRHALQQHHVLLMNRTKGATPSADNSALKAEAVRIKALLETLK